MTDLPATVWTIGHSNRSLDDFLAILAHYRIEAVADVRRFPGSRRQPQFGSPALADALASHGIACHWFEALGGRRKLRPDAPPTVWRNPSFQAYADYLSSPEFGRGLADLLALAARRRTVLMCAEVLWWRCHRAILADVLKARGIEVIHIRDADHATVHPYTSAARIVDGRLSYAPA